MRAIAPEDSSRIVAYFGGLSFGTRYFGFGCAEVRFSEHELNNMCDPPPHVCRRFIAVTSEQGAKMPIGSGAIELLEDGKSGELSIHVADAWQGAGVAHALLNALAHYAIGVGLKRMQAKVLASNWRMVNFVQRHGFKQRAETATDAIRVYCFDLEGAGKAWLNARNNTPA